MLEKIASVGEACIYLKLFFPFLMYLLKWNKQKRRRERFSVRGIFCMFGFLNTKKFIIFRMKKLHTEE